MNSPPFMTGHRKFRGNFKNETALFHTLAEEGQHPKVLWFGCSDSRVIPEQIIGADPGELFIMRNVANIIPPYASNDLAVGSVLEYAIHHLKVPHIVICGHSQCGGIGVLREGRFGLSDRWIASWLAHAKPALDRIHPDAEDPFVEMILINILLQKENLLTWPFVREMVESGGALIHLLYFDIHDGLLSVYDEAREQWETLI